MIRKTEILDKSGKRGGEGLLIVRRTVEYVKGPVNIDGGLARSVVVKHR